MLFGVMGRPVFRYTPELDEHYNRNERLDSGHLGVKSAAGEVKAPAGDAAREQGVWLLGQRPLNGDLGID
jgi:hypothetical protein